jgi:hypothetical protein
VDLLKKLGELDSAFIRFVDVICVLEEAFEAFLDVLIVVFGSEKEIKNIFWVLK